MKSLNEHKELLVESNKAKIKEIQKEIASLEKENEEGFATEIKNLKQELEQLTESNILITEAKNDKFVRGLSNFIKFLFKDGKNPEIYGLDDEVKALKDSGIDPYDVYHMNSLFPKDSFNARTLSKPGAVSKGQSNIIDAKDKEIFLKKSAAIEKFHIAAKAADNGYWNKW